MPATFIEQENRTDATRHLRFDGAHGEFEDFLQGRARVQQLEHAQTIAFPALDPLLLAEVAHGDDDETPTLCLERAQAHLHHKLAATN